MISLSQVRNRLACSIVSEFAYKGFDSGETQYVKVNSKQVQARKLGGIYTIAECNGPDLCWEAR